MLCMMYILLFEPSITYPFGIHCKTSAASRPPSLRRLPRGDSTSRPEFAWTWSASVSASVSRSIVGNSSSSSSSSSSCTSSSSSSTSRRPSSNTMSPSSLATWPRGSAWSSKWVRRSRASSSPCGRGGKPS